MSNNKFVTESVLEFTLNKFKEEMVNLIDARFPTELNADCTDLQIPSAKLVYEFVTQLVSHIEVVVGPINAVAAKSKTLYLQLDTADDTTFRTYFHDGSKWLVTGAAMADSKDEIFYKEDLSELTEENMSNILDNVFNKSDDSSSDKEDA